MIEYSYTDFLGHRSIKHNPSGYSLDLDISEDSTIFGGPARFPHKIGPLDCFFRASSPNGGTPLIITGRDLNEHDQFLRDLCIDPSLQYVEIGAGLGEFTPSLVDRYNGSLEHKPIVIDPADYQVIRELLKYAIDFGFCDELNDKFREWIKRCDTILDPNKVTLVNLTLGDALSENTYLNGSSDVVIDHRGPLTYPSTETIHDEALGDDVIKQRVSNLEKRLAKPGGILLSDGLTKFRGA